MKIETGVMVMKDGKAWGKIYADGNSTSFGWISPEEAPLLNPKFCKKPEDLAYIGSQYREELKKGQVVHVERRTEVIVKA